MNNAHDLLTYGLLKDHKRRLEAVLVNPMDKQLNRDYQAVTSALNDYEWQEAKLAFRGFLNELAGNSIGLAEEFDEHDCHLSPEDGCDCTVELEEEEEEIDEWERYEIREMMKELGYPDKLDYQDYPIYYEDERVLIH